MEASGMPNPRSTAQIAGHPIHLAMLTVQDSWNAVIAE
jgi:hypothetical protein